MRMKQKFVAALAVVILVQSLPAWALDATSALEDCKRLKQVAIEAQLADINRYTPRVDPVQTFTLATDVCLNFITNFDIGLSLSIPSLGDLDAFLRRLATAIVTRVCMAATQQFNSAVNDALKSVNDQLAPINSIPGVSVGIGGNTNGVGVNVGSVVGSDGGATANNVLNNVTNRVINTLK